MPAAPVTRRLEGVMSRWTASWLRLGALAAIGAALLLGAHSATAQDGETALVIDADPAQAGVQTERAEPIAVGDIFHVRVVLRSLGPDVYGAYQITLEYPAAFVEPAGLPDNWGNEPTADTGGNLLQFTSGALCDPSPTLNSISPVFDGIGGLAMTCAELDFADTTSNTGELVDMVFRCIAPGTVALGLSTIDNTFILDAHLLGEGTEGIYGDVFEGATVTCAGEALTATPAAAETSTQNPASTPAGSTPAGASPGTSPSAGADTGGGTSGGDDDDGGAPWALIIFIGIVAAVAVGGALAFAARRGRA